MLCRRLRRQVHWVSAHVTLGQNKTNQKHNFSPRFSTTSQWIYSSYYIPTWRSDYRSFNSGNIREISCLFSCELCRRNRTIFGDKMQSSGGVTRMGMGMASDKELSDLLDFSAVSIISQFNYILYLLSNISIALNQLISHVNTFDISIRLHGYCILVYTTALWLSVLDCIAIGGRFHWTAWHALKYHVCLLLCSVSSTCYFFILK